MVGGDYISSIEDLTGVIQAREQERQLRLQLTRDEEARGHEHPSLCATLIRLGVVVAKQGRAAEAEPIVERALRISQATPGALNAATAQILIVLAQIQAVMRRPQASATAKRALDGLQKTLGPDHPTTKNAVPLLTRIAASGQRQAWGAQELAEELEQGVEALRAHDAEGSMDILIPVADRARDANAPAVESYARGMLAQALFLAGRKEAAIKEAREALKIAQENGHQDAAQHFAELLRHLESVDGKSEGTRITDYNARIREALERAHKGDPEAAFRELEEIARQAKEGGAAGPEASARIVLGQIYMARGDKTNASVELRRALEISELVGDAPISSHVQKLLADL